MLAAGDPIKARLIYMTTKVADAVICSRHLLKLKKEAEFHRQRLHSVIIKAAGGSYEPDQSLLELDGPRKERPDVRTAKDGWLKMIRNFKAKVDPKVLEVLRG